MIKQIDPGFIFIGNYFDGEVFTNDLMPYTQYVYDSMKKTVVDLMLSESLKGTNKNHFFIAKIGLNINREIEVLYPNPFEHATVVIEKLKTKSLTYTS